MLGRHNRAQPEHLLLLKSEVPQVVLGEGGVAPPHTSLHYLLDGEVTGKENRGA